MKGAGARPFHPAGLHPAKEAARAARPGWVFVRVRPGWIRYSDYNRNPPLIAELARNDLPNPG